MLPLQSLLRASRSRPLLSLRQLQLHLRLPVPRRASLSICSCCGPREVAWLLRNGLLQTALLLLLLTVVLALLRTLHCRL